MNFPLINLPNAFIGWGDAHFAAGVMIASLGGLFGLRELILNLWDKSKKRARWGFILIGIAIAGAISGLYLIVAAIATAILIGVYLLFANNIGYAISGEDNKNKN